jgi:pimeloyl-ACP methyl ester carboxylesterase
LIDYLKIERAFLLGVSYGSTLVFKAIHREPPRFPKAAVQGAFSRRDFSWAERWALRLGRLVPGTVARLPFRERVLAYNSKSEFPRVLADRWEFYLEQNALTPINSLAHRVGLLTQLDLRPIIPEISTEVLVIQGNEDRIVARRYFDQLKCTLPRARGVIMPTVGHLPHLTHAEILGRLIGDWFLPCAPGDCLAEQGGPRDCQGAG